MRWALLGLAATLTACGAGPLDACARFGSHSCLVVRAHGRDPVDQLELTALSGFALQPNPGRSPPSAAMAFSLPALVPIDLGAFAGDFRLRVAGLRQSSVLSVGEAEDTMKRGERKLLEVQLVRVDSDGGLDLAVELPDLATDDGPPVKACSVDCGVLPNVDPSKVRCLGISCDVSGACLAGRGHCSMLWQDGCEADFTSAQTCGSCTHQCSASEPLCAAGVGCVGSCTGSTPQQCGSGCVSFTDPNTCGGCDMRCGAPAGGVPTCDGGVCGFVCPAGSTRVGDSCTEWAIEPSGVSDNLLSINGASANQIWIGSELGVLLDLQTTGGWRRRTISGAGDFHGIWISDTLELWIASTDGKVYRSTNNINFNGTTVNTAGGLYAISGNNTATGPWVTGLSQIWHWTGSTWSPDYNDTNASLQGVWASESTVFAVGSYAHFMNPVIVYEGLVLTSPGWTRELPNPRQFLGVWGLAPDNFYVVGRGGMILRRTATEWKLENNIGPALYAIGGKLGDLYAVGDEGTILHSTGDGVWTAQTSGVNLGLRGVYSYFSTTWVVGDSGVILKKL